MSTPKLPIDAVARGRLPILLRHAWYGLNQAFRRRIAHLDLTPDQYTALRTLHEHGKITQKELARLMASDPNTIASLMDRMESCGFVAREQDERDRRARRLCLLPAGRRKYQAGRELAQRLQEQVISALAEDERPLFLSQLAAVAEACRAASQSSFRPAAERTRT